MKRDEVGGITFLTEGWILTTSPRYPPSAPKQGQFYFNVNIIDSKPNNLGVVPKKTVACCLVATTF